MGRFKSIMKTTQFRTMVWSPKQNQLIFDMQKSRNNLLRDNYESEKFLKCAIASVSNTYLKMYFERCLEQLKSYGIQKVEVEEVREVVNG